MEVPQPEHSTAEVCTAETRTAEARKVYPSDLRRAERRRQQKAAKREPERQRYIELSQRLQFVADELSHSEDEEMRRELLKLIYRMRLCGSTTKPRDDEEVMEAITEHQCHCVYDIHEQTGLARAQIWKIIDGLLTTGQLEERHRKAGERERDEMDTLFYPTGRASSSADVRP